MGEMKNCGRTINHYEQDKVFLNFYDQDSQDSNIVECVECAGKSYFNKIFKFLTNFTKKFKS